MGSPLPNITWYKNNVSINVSNKVSEDEVISELVIGQFQPSDQATYKCVARNKYNNTVQTGSKIGKAPIYFFFNHFYLSFVQPKFNCSVPLRVIT